MFNFRTSLALSETTLPQCITVVVTVSLQAPKVATTKSYRPPMRPATSRVLALLPPLSPLTSTCVVAVASGNGYWPCISFTKYFLKGIRKRIPRIPPSSEERNIWTKFTSRPRI